MTAASDSCIFGPVVSRRLGRSLGVDVIPFKTCPYDCLYCEQGRTTHHTLQRDHYLDISRALDEVKAFLEGHVPPDFITLSGAGEPTLHTGLGSLILQLKEITSVPVAVITNGALLWQPEVQEALSAADVILPSLDGGNEKIFQRIDRPVAGISFSQMLSGLISFRDRYKGEIWLEIFLMEGLNDDDASLRELASLASRIRPDKIQLNTVERPPATKTVEALSIEGLERCASFFDPPAEIISPRYPLPDEREILPQEAPILEMLRRRPCPLEEIAAGLGFHRLETSKLLAQLIREGKIREEIRGDITFFSFVTGDE
ncbi:MAG: radical SAM protein [Candidatus Hydrogenedens sp.]|jgi:wyosine [tRNA(Phe)-imidazoG37] synthetase (radical SAM superfamily)|nr:radical SAM protein [Candidatus Hydrogenedens sp.]